MQTLTNQLISKVIPSLRSRVQSEFGSSAFIQSFSPQNVVQRDNQYMRIIVVVNVAERMLYGVGNNENEIIDSLKQNQELEYNSGNERVILS